MIDGANSQQDGRKSGHGVRRPGVPELGREPILETLDARPQAPPAASETRHDQARRALINQPGQWLVLNTRTRLTEAGARRLARSYQRAKPTRLDPTAAGRFTAQPFLHETTWLVAASFEPATSDLTPSQKS